MLNVLLIENQYRQFAKLQRLIGISPHQWTVYPPCGEIDGSTTDYRAFMDWVKLFLMLGISRPDAEDHPTAHQCLKQLIEYIGSNKITHVICDYKLAGNSRGQTGIWLIRCLAEHGVVLPVVFLSVASVHDANVEEKLSELDEFDIKYEWVEKSFRGSPPLEMGIILDRVAKAIGRLGAKTRLDTIRLKIVQTCLAHDYPQATINLLDDTLNKPTLPQILASKLEEIHAYNDTHARIEEVHVKEFYELLLSTVGE